jgi:2-polyprenyl-6-hydroxyphenyl methylase/3-demethylubiquinone-9 3-methyltransferase
MVAQTGSDSSPGPTTDRTRADATADLWWPPRKGYAILYKANSLRFAYFDRHVSDWEGLKVLDVGCGGGYTCEFLARRRAAVFGTDISESSLEAARRHAAKSGLRIDYRLGKPGFLPFADAQMDVVTCFQVLEHVRDVRTTLSEVRRVLKPQGRLFFDTVTRTLWSRIAAILLGEIVFRLIERGTHDWRLFIKPEEIERRLRESGFGNVELAGLKLEFPARETGGLPFRVSRGGRRSIVYFGSTIRQDGWDSFRVSSGSTFPELPRERNL